MKPVLMCMGLLLVASATVQSQTKKPSKSKSAQAAATPGITLRSTGSYEAKGPLNMRRAAHQFTISDPVLNALDARAKGAKIEINGSGIVGMPKSAYGFANGHLSLKTTGAVTSGTQTGSGAVATGTSLGTFGSLGPAMAVNGKSPYAGTIMWGNARNIYLPAIDPGLSANPAADAIAGKNQKDKKPGRQ